MKLLLVEQFYSLQGEGAHTGRAAWFVRLAGCDVGCRWCDSRESWNASGFPMVEVDEIVRRAEAGAVSKTVVVTGGEPLTHNLDELCARLHERGFAVHLETSGTRPFTGNFDWVCLSPKRQRPPSGEAWGRADEVKVVVETEGDLEWAAECASRMENELCGKVARKFLQPEWGRRDEILPRIIEYIKQNPQWRLSLQAHKYIGVE